MKNIGVWVNAKEAVIIKIAENQPHTIKRIKSNIELRERVNRGMRTARDKGHLLIDVAKTRLRQRTEQRSEFLKNLTKEIDYCDSVVLVGPRKMTNDFEKQIKRNQSLSHKLKDVHYSEFLPLGKMVAWTSDYLSLIHI